MSLELTLLPTLTCFDDCARYLFHQVVKDQTASTSRLDRFRLVHGVCNACLQDDATIRPYSHAWIVDITDKTVIDFGKDDDGKVYAVKIDQKSFHASRRVSESVTYTLKEAALANAVTDSSGPWRRFLYELTSDYDPDNRRQLQADRLGTYRRHF